MSAPLPASVWVAPDDVAFVRRALATYTCPDDVVLLVGTSDCADEVADLGRRPVLDASSADGAPLALARCTAGTSPRAPAVALSRLTERLAALVPVLRPGAVVLVAVTSSAKHVDLATSVLAAGEAAGLVPYERLVLLRAPVDGDQIIGPSQPRVAGAALLVVHDELVAMRVPR